MLPTCPTRGRTSDLHKPTRAFLVVTRTFSTSKSCEFHVALSSLKLIRQVYCIEPFVSVRESGGTAPLILNLAIRQGCVASFSPCKLCSQNSLNRKMGGTCSLPGRSKEVTHLLTLPGTEPWFLGSPACFAVTTLTEQSRFRTIEVLK